ncbi:nitrate reductase [Sodiomyces alkalinus F11]|uniref:Nitrate reductase n=1 Tax=Sodiomyces alkalinus (strain CBS 110278 / VKM F-3762 / F11) TaxID=1314773 RepID=A0A3N2PW22_SODAK|nr:nitrate reductase [Sodiomyces alkalinus F11]ROT38703.1 nitrate reductase [Sodiomyces alkalinus F11]
MAVLGTNSSFALLPTSVPLKSDLTFPPSPAETIKGSRPSSVDGDAEEPSELCLFEELDAERPRVYPLPPRSQPNSVLPEDLKTPDSHVPRDPRLIRLTGVHPFNVEPPLSDLYDQGFLTNKDLHYVRNHGAVPKVQDEDVLNWEFTVEGMVEAPFTIPLRDLIAEYEQITYPATLVCAGNRRKEQNVVRKTKGFSWGAAGLSTALWTGVSLGDLLARAVPKRGARYVCFEGADKLPNGYYGTSIKLNWATDPNRGVTVCYRMNGELLHPDHGRPVRIIIPGQIGGRSVKWLKRIIVTKEPSDNWYHIYDNRVLPTPIDPEASADLPDVWKDERYAIYDLNTNSATCYPAHDETLSLSDEDEDEAPESYAVRGYAYGGGGRRVTRVEVTLDKGKSWTLADIRYPEDDYRLAPEGDTLYGGRMDMAWRETCFCWCFWQLDIPVAQLAGASDIMVRAMDEGLMVQPRDMYWSVLGMMNNPWYRVAIHRQGRQLRFEHPTQPALISGGWMERVKKEGGNLSNGFWGEKVQGDEQDAVEQEPPKDICMTKEGVKRSITINELRQHAGEDEPWFVVNGEVYDGTPFLEGHPGGAASIFGAAGQDATEEFLTIHSENAKASMPEYHIGTLDEAGRKALSTEEVTTDADAEGARAIFLQPKVWTKAILSGKRAVSSDSKIFTFDLEHAEQQVGLPVGQHLMMRLRDPVTRGAIIRAYTPISEGTDRGKLQILIKIYRNTPDRKGGSMTQALDSIPVGHFVDMKGPVGKFEYLGRGLCSVSGKQRRVKRFIMVCAGSGVTPIFQVLRAVMRDPDDATRCLVLDGNRAEEDILCRTELDAMAASNPDRCKLLYLLTQPAEGWTGLRGRMDAALFEREVGPCRTTEGDEMVLICGPEAMEQSVKAILSGMGWKEEHLLVF